MFVLLFIAAPVVAYVVWRLSRRGDAKLPDEHAMQRALLAAAWVCALGEFAVLAIWCAAQFEPQFSTQDAIGGFMLAISSAVLASLVGLAALFAGARRKEPLRLLICVWAGFVGFILLGFSLSDTARAVRLRTKPNPALERTLQGGNAGPVSGSPSSP